MTRVLKELAVVVSTYQDRNTGEDKRRYRNIGVLMEGESNGETYEFLLLNRDFNPAGVPAREDKVLINLFDPKPRDEPRQQSPSQNTGYDADPQGTPNAAGGYGGGSYEEEVPF